MHLGTFLTFTIFISILFSSYIKYIVYKENPDSISQVSHLLYYFGTFIFRFCCTEDEEQVRFIICNHTYGDQCVRLVFANQILL